MTKQIENETGEAQSLEDPGTRLSAPAAPSEEGSGERRFADIEERLARSFARAVTRRKMFSRAMRTGLVVGGALAAPSVLFAGKAEAAPGCAGNYLGICECAQETPNCGELGAACTAGGACNPSSGLRVRCSYWTVADEQGQYCWCGAHCNYGGGVQGHRVCCDCWKGGSGSCSNNSGTKCLCASWVGE
jgi:hypothetical protein